MLHMATGKLAHCKLTNSICYTKILQFNKFMNTITNYILSAKTTGFLHISQSLSALSTVVMIAYHKSMRFHGNLSSYSRVTCNKKSRKHDTEQDSDYL